MGTWSANIFDNDGAEEIKEEYKTLLGYGMSLEEAYKRIEDYFYPNYKDQDDEDVYWLSIALFQWENGILQDEVKQHALECIANDEYLEIWKEDAELYAERKRVLEDLKYKLINIKKEKRKRFPKCPLYYRHKTKWEEGDLLAYKIVGPLFEYDDIEDESVRTRIVKTQKEIVDKYILLRVVEVDKTPVTPICPELDYSSIAVVMLYDWVGDTLPTETEISCLKYKPIVDDFWCSPKKIVSSICLEEGSPKEDREWCEITLLKHDKDFETPQMYLQHKHTPFACVSNFDLQLVWTFDLTEEEETKWATDGHFFADRD